MNSPHPVEPLGGRLRLRPGLPRPHNLLSSRQDWAARLAPRRPAADWPALVGGLYSLCGQSQQLCARLALAAALGQATPTGGAEALRQETLREHLRRILLDWPHRLAAPAEAEAQALQALARCPVFSPSAQSLGDWLAAHALGLCAKTWLQGWEQDPAAFLRDWCDHTPGWLPALLRQARPDLDQPLAHSPALPFPGRPADWLALARPLALEPGFSIRPQWLGGCADTGPWNRSHQRRPEALNTPWLRLGARLAELVRLSQADEAGRSGQAWLRQASCSLGPGEGLAAVEMARGLLIHRVQLADQGPAPRLLNAQVLAPTEWNFHPQGSVAQALETLCAGQDRARADQQAEALVCAYDPCVQHEFEEVSHA